MARRNLSKSNDSIAVAIDNDKSSQYALKWTVEYLLSKGQALTLLHVKTKASSISSRSTGVNGGGATVDANGDVARAYKQQMEGQSRELFLPFRCFCVRKEIQCNEVIIEGSDIAKGIIEYTKTSVLDVVILGASTRSGLFRFKSNDVPGGVTKGAPDFCTVYVISKGKILIARTATSAPPKKPLLINSPLSSQGTGTAPVSPNALPPYQSDSYSSPNQIPREKSPWGQHSVYEDVDIKSPFTRPGMARSYEWSSPETDISFVSSERPSTDRSFLSLYDNMDHVMLSSCSEYEYRSMGRSSYSTGGRQSFESSFQKLDLCTPQDEGSRMSISSSIKDDVEAEMRRLRLELKQTMDMYSTACKEAIAAKEQAREFQRFKLQEEQKLEEARMGEEAALELAEREKAKCRAAMETADAAQKIAEKEAQKRINAEKNAILEAEEGRKMMNFRGQGFMYRRYMVEEIEAATDNFAPARKIGEGGYGPVYKCYLDHTAVAIKLLRPDATRGRSQFQQEVEVLSCIRHPNMVLLLGACPEYGCLVYEHMANGSLEDRLFRLGNTPALPWQLRFRIAAEIATGLLFLHRAKPEPLVHRDLKPANILLDRNYVSKISDVGLARLVPPSVADSVTQYRMTATAGTFCYIDPEYQQTGMLGIKSDIYSLGIMLLQIITAKPPMGLTCLVGGAIERDTFAEILDSAVTDWPVEEAMRYAKVAIKCAELRRKDRPDLGMVVLPELNRLRELAEQSMSSIPPFVTGTIIGSATPFSSTQEVIADPLRISGYESSSTSTNERI
ncbi:hypothetical protein SAY86_007936 [Trapa natans]|uniref:Protein kinase domain-containing protein n=1 Tax=Trapa natans TaxID=22666 RepID=A0AAN7LPW3_TRANT|nr:hypothetical protein SAY86_007936 [Trapa natans]